MTLKEKVKDTIKTNGCLKNGDRVIVGISGGPDSVCLLHVLLTLSLEWDLTLYGVHINHGLRGEAADKDQAYVTELCKKWGIPLRVASFDVARIAKERGLSVEDAGRRVRYETFFSVGEEVCAQKIAVAHNANDQAETVFMRIMRGTGTEGLSGMEYKRADGVIRPLLDVSRTEIEAYCDENSLLPRLDLTNLEPDYTRNRIRLEVFPYLQEHFNKNVMGALNRLAAISSEDQEFLGGLALSAIEACGPGTLASGQLPLGLLREKHPALRKRMILQMFKALGLSQNISAVHLKQAEKLIEQGHTGGVAEFPSGYVMKLTYDRVLFCKEEILKKNREENREIGCNKAVNGYLTERLITQEEWREKQRQGELWDVSQNGVRVYLDYEAVKNRRLPLSLRTRRPGDFIGPLGMQGTKKLKDYLIDKKVSREQRDQIPLVCLGSEVVWAVGLQLGEKFKVAAETGEILLLEYHEKM